VQIPVGMQDEHLNNSHRLENLAAQRIAKHAADRAGAKRQIAQRRRQPHTPFDLRHESARLLRGSRVISMSIGTSTRSPAVTMSIEVRPLPIAASVGGAPASARPEHGCARSPPSCPTARVLDVHELVPLAAQPVERSLARQSNRLDAVQFGAIDDHCIFVAVRFQRVR